MLIWSSDDIWEVTLLAEEVPLELPEPTLGINLDIDGMVRRDWLTRVAMRSDSWLLSMAFYLAALFNHGERPTDREHPDTSNEASESLQPSSATP